MSTVGRLGAMLVRMHHDLDPKRFIPATSDTEKRYGGFLRTQLDEPKIVILVAEQDGSVIGYTYAGVEGTDYMSLRGPAGALYDIVVDPSIADRHGRMLLDATVDALKGKARREWCSVRRKEVAQHLSSAPARRTMIEMTRELDD